MTTIRDDYLSAANGDEVLAAVNFAYDLTVGDPATFKVGYTPANAALSAVEVFPGIPLDTIERAVEMRIEHVG